MPYVVIALLLLCLPPFSFFSPCFSFLFMLHSDFPDHISLLLFPFSSYLAWLPCYFLGRNYYQLCFRLTVPVPTPHPAQRRGDGAARPGGDRFPGTATATWATGTASPLAPPPLLCSTSSFFAINTRLCFSPVPPPPQMLCLQHPTALERAGWSCCCHGPDLSGAQALQGGTWPLQLLLPGLIIPVRNNFALPSLFFLNCSIFPRVLNIRKSSSYHPLAQQIPVTLHFSLCTQDNIILWKDLLR